MRLGVRWGATAVEREGGRVSDKKKQGLCVGGRYKAVWALVRISVGALSPGDICLSVCVHRHSASGGQACRCQEWGGAQAEIVYGRVYILRCQGGGVAGVLSFGWRRIDAAPAAE